MKFKLEDDTDVAPTEEAKPTDTPTFPALKMEQFDLSPNPSSGEVHLSFKTEAGPVTIQVIDLQGRVVKELQLPAFDGFFDDILTIESKGTHFVNIKQGDKVHNVQVIIE